MGRRNTVMAKKDQITQLLKQGLSITKIAEEVNEPYQNVRRFIWNHVAPYEDSLILCCDCDKLMVVKYCDRHLRICTDRESVIPSKTDIAPKGFCRYGKMV